MLDLIAKSDLARNVTVKGGVLMQHVSNDTRRATTDFDLDFVRFSIADDSIRKFIGALSDGSSTFSIRMTGKIEQLKHQDYSGKRIHVVISDAQGSSIETKVDIGVHNLVSPDLAEICFDLGKLDDAVTILADSNEQVVAEKLRSLLRIGARPPATKMSSTSTTCSAKKVCENVSSTMRFAPLLSKIRQCVREVTVT